MQSKSGPRRCLHRGTWSCSPFHRGPTDHKRSVGLLLSLPEVYNQLFGFAHVQRETVVLAPWCESLHLIQVCGLIVVGNEAQNHSISANLTIEVELWEDTQSCVERVEQGAQDTTLWGSYVQGYGVGGELADFHHLWSGVRKSWIQSQSEVFRPRSESLTASLVGTIVLKAEL